MGPLVVVELDPVNGEHMGQRREKMADDRRGMGVTGVNRQFSLSAIPELSGKAARP